MFSGSNQMNIKHIWNKYDDDHSGKLDIKEFTEFLHEIRINVGKKLNAQEVFIKVDADNSGKIDFNEFVNYYEELTSAKEFVDVFARYNTSSVSDVLDIFDLIKFMFEVQNETVSFEEAIRLILNYNKQIPDADNFEIQSILEK